jgi:hypothetical protein
MNCPWDKNGQVSSVKDKVKEVESFCQGEKA